MAWTRNEDYPPVEKLTRAQMKKLSPEELKEYRRKRQAWNEVQAYRRRMDVPGAKDAHAQYRQELRKQRAKEDAEAYEEEGWEPAWLALLQRYRKRGIKKVIADHVDALEISKWLYNNYAMPVSRIDHKTIPTLGAIAHLRSLRRSPGAFQRFSEKLFEKLMPTQREVDLQAHLQEDQRKKFPLLESFMNSLPEEGTELPEVVSDVPEDEYALEDGNDGGDGQAASQ